MSTREMMGSPTGSHACLLRELAFEDLDRVGRRLPLQLHDRDDDGLRARGDECDDGACGRERRDEQHDELFPLHAAAPSHRVGLGVNGRCATPFVMRRLSLALVSVVVLAVSDARAQDTKPWCSPEVQELSDHVCYYDGQAEGAEPPVGDHEARRKTLVIYLHGMYAATPGFQHLQQMALARQAKAHKITMLFPTAPKADFGYAWPTSLTSQKEEEPKILEGIKKSKEELEKKLNRKFDETFVVGFSSGAYFGSSVAVRGNLDVDGFIILVGGSSWARPASESSKRAPIFVGVSAADKQTAAHTRAFAGTLAALHWPYRVEERDVGHTVDWVFLAHGLAYLRSQKKKS